MDAIPVTAVAALPAPTTPAATTEKPQGFGPVAGVSKDRDGRVFDASKFLPEKDHNGRWKRIGGPGKPGRPKGSKSAPKPAEPPQQPAPDFSDVRRVIDAATTPPPAPESAATSEAPLPTLPRDNTTNSTAETLIGILQMLLVMIGDEEGVLTDLEKNLLRTPIVRLLKKYEVADDFLPEEAELAVAVSGIVIDRIRRGGKTASWWEGTKAWALNKFFGIKGALLGRAMRSEVPENMVDKLAARVQELQAELARKTAAPAGDPDVVQFPS